MKITKNKYNNNLFECSITLDEFNLIKNIFLIKLNNTPKYLSGEEIEILESINDVIRLSEKNKIVGKTKK